MKIKNLKLKIIFCLFAICYLLFAAPVKAQEISVGIDPPIIQIETKTPARIKTPVTIQNASDQTVTYNIFLFSFKPGKSNNGQPEFDNNLSDDYKKIFSRIKILDENRSLTEITLAPKQKKELNLSISVSKDDVPKDYYFSVVFISQELDYTKENSSLGARAGIGTNILLAIGPKSLTQGHIEEFSAPKFVNSGPVKFKLNVANTSKHFVTIKGNLVIKNMLGQVVGNIDLVPVNILAESNRLIESSDNKNSLEPRVNWNEKFLLGIYKADLTLALSDEGPLLRKSLTFFAFPAQAIILILLAVALLIGVIRRARSKSDSTS